jgi:hypothetical protein
MHAKALPAAGTAGRVLRVPFASLFERNSARSFRHDECRPASNRHCANHLSVKIADGMNPDRSPPRDRQADQVR